jgi:signal transduction histidine kinase
VRGVNDIDDFQRQAGARLAAQFCAILSLIICGISLLGHLMGISALYSVNAQFAAMSPVTSVSCALIGIAALPRLSSYPRMRIGLCFAASLIAALVALSWLLTGTDLWNGFISGAIHGNVGQTSPATAIGILLIAASLVTAQTPFIKASDLLAGAAFLLSGFAALGHAYGASDLYAIPWFHTMSLNTAITLFLIALASVLARERGGWAQILASAGVSGFTTRRQITFLALPPVAGFVLILLVDKGYFGLPGAMTLLVTLTIGPLLWLVLRDGRTMTDLDRERKARTADEAAHLTLLEDRLAAQAKQIEAQNLFRIHQAEAASLRSEDRYHRLFNSLDVGFCVVEMKFDARGEAVDYRFVEANAAFEAHTGLSNPVGQWMRTLAPSHEPHWFEIYGRVANTRQSTRFENPAKALDDRWYDVHAFPVDDMALNRVGILFTDITARRQSELKLREWNETLESRIEAAVAESEAAQEALRQSQKMETIGQLTGGVAHDFNNLLVPILGNLDLLRRRSTGDEREKRMIDGALQSAQRAKTLIQRLLAFARRQPLQVAPVDIGQLIENIADIVTRTTGPQIEVVVDIGTDLPPALADANQVEMAILNLSVNARDAMPDGGKLTIAADQAVIAGDTSLNLAPGKYVCLSVVDTGTGMDAETAARAIEPFFSTKGIGKGTGLGLSMVHGLASQLNGTLKIETEPGAGTSIRLWLPASTETPTDIASTELIASHIVVHKGLALVVDDEDQVRQTTAEMLKDLGYETIEVADAFAAGVILEEGRQVELVVTDHLMPGMTGAELATRIRSKWPQISILLISGYAEPKGVPADLPRLTKPFDQEALSMAILGMKTTELADELPE